MYAIIHVGDEYHLYKDSVLVGRFATIKECVDEIEKLKLKEVEEACQT